MKTKGLTLLEAHNSGRKYRRANRPDATEFYRLTDTATDPRWLMPVENALATDYELEPEAKLLTREDIMSLVNDSSFIPFTRSELVHEYLTQLCNKLFGKDDV